MHGPSDKQPRSIRQKYSLDYYRRSLPTRSWKSPWNWTVLIISLLSVAGLYLLRRDQPFQAAPVSAAHSTFGANCSECHDQRWSTALRLATLSAAHRSVSDAACQKCHQAAPHVPNLLVDEACARCHQEHRPEQSLTQLADSNCTQCHANLDVHLAGASFIAPVTQFAAGDGGHPEFAVLRADASGVGPRHRARQVASFAPNAAGQGQWLDRGRLKFNHARHLAANGVFDADGKAVQLVCADCHVPDSAGAYMMPIHHETHCARCHRILLGAPLDLDVDRDLPHADVEQVRGVIRERLARAIEKNALVGAAAVATPDNRNAPSRKLPLLPRPARLAADQERELATLMELADHSVFGLEAKAGCRKCHEVDVLDGTWFVAGTGSDGAAMVPPRWLLHGEFDHDAHRAVECAACHRVDKSTQTSDILLPSIAVCRECHGVEPATVGVMPVRDDCVLCHTFHAESEPFPGVPLDRLFGESPEASASNLP
jgi:hypothetical protein